MKTQLRRAVAWCEGTILSGALAAGLSACVGGPTAIEGPSPAPTFSETAETASPQGGSPCYSAFLYLVEGDHFTFLSGERGTLEAQGRSSGVNPMLAGAPREPRVTGRFDVDGFHGSAELLWDGAAVDSFAFDAPFVESSGTRVLAFRAPDDTQVELHVYVRESCRDAFPPEMLTRAEVEALEM